MSKKLSSPPPPLSREDRLSPPPAPPGIAATVAGIALPCGCIVNMDGRTSYCEAHRKLAYLCDRCDRPYQADYETIPEPGKFLCPECKGESNE